jgi:hypothetical protein
MPPAAAMQILFDGTTEEAPTDDALTFEEFRRRSKKEEGLLTISQLADVLDVSQTRADQLVRAGTLDSWKFMGRLYVSAAQAAERRAADIRTGRPPRTVKQRVQLVAKMMVKSTVAQIAAET